MTTTSTPDRVQRVLNPTDGDTSVLPLYVSMDDLPYVRPFTRDAFRIIPGERRSFAAYFGAFPAAWWVRYTAIRSVTLTMTVSGAAAFDLMVSDVEGVAHLVGRVEASDGDLVTDVVLPENAGWVWFEVDAPRGAELTDVAWQVAEPAVRDVRAVACVTTMNRPDECLGILRDIAADAAALGAVAGIVVVDQGTDRVRDAAGFEDVAQRLGDRLRIVEQANHGGSGGFSRGMIEAREWGATHALLLDDDVRLETDALARLAAFAAHASHPDTIVGAQMLSTDNPTVLHSMGERVDRDAYWWTPVDKDLAPVDLAGVPLESSPSLHRPYDVDFNGWWMCLIPLSLTERIGMSMPFFLKWDDTEFSLRAATVAAPTVTLPGAALWHVPWTSKDDGLDWQAYFQLRNRMITALLHAPKRPRRLLSTSFAQEVNHVLCLQYGSAAVRNQALADVLRGPGALRPDQSTLPQRINAELAVYSQLVIPVSEQPRVDESWAVHVGTPASPIGAARRLVRIILRQLRPTLPTERTQTVQFSLNRQDARWWRAGLLDSIVLRSATGKGGFVLRRDRAKAFRLLRDAARLRLRLLVRWSALARQYRREAASLASETSWSRRFDARTAVSASSK